ncbi:MAG: 4-(cytidine 5'-diphospho)-2-C-methyl-D-erythritol kinase [Burkholderiales bacterium]|nr:4-(cytidine 5'-diphospho)-2-C-methyl-D-erythritol kinase [Burkholderiales bacterium]
MEDKSKFISYLSPAKLNLGLKIVGKRSDGYHLLKTIFCLIDLYDRIKIEVTNDSKITLVGHNQMWPYETDLGFKAASLLQKISGTNFGANIIIDKVIPVGAGLGGGSSNAATVLTALNYLWQLNLNNNELIDIGRSLGADVPFFIYGKNAYAGGIGDEFTPINLAQRYFVLVKPEFQIPTPKIFAAFKLDLNNDFSFINSEYLLNTLSNDLEEVAITVYPQLKKIINNLAQNGKFVMTGSGSTLFMQFDDLENANKVAYALRKSYNTYLVKSMDVSPIFMHNP